MSVYETEKESPGQRRKQGDRKIKKQSLKMHFALYPGLVVNIDRYSAPNQVYFNVILMTQNPLSLCEKAQVTWDY